MKGFTLLELLIILAVIGLLAAIVLPIMCWIIGKNLIADIGFGITMAVAG